MWTVTAQRQLRTCKVFQVSSVVDRLGVPTPGAKVTGTRLLIAGVVAFVGVLAVWAIYTLNHSSGYTLYPADLDVYRDGGLIVRHISPPYDAKLANPLYDWPLNNEALKFTYTPFAALFFAAVSFIPWNLLPRLSEVANLIALVAASWCTMAALGYTDRRVRAGGAFLAAAAGLLTEPVFRTLYLGQINLLLMALIIWDLCQPDTPASRRWKGLATGFAAGIKLVPLIFIPYLLLTRKFRQAAMASGGFIVTVVLGFVLLPGDSKDWWFHGLFIQDGRTGFTGWSGNQSLRAIATRLAGSIDAATVPWVVGVVLVTVLGLLAAVMLYRAGHQMLGLLTTALVGLFDSPISWDHHWVWIVPGMMAAVHYAVRAWRAGRRRGAFGCGALALAMLLVFGAWPGGLFNVITTGPGNFTFGLIWSAPYTPVKFYIKYGDQPWFLEYHWHVLQFLTGNAYILAGLVLFVILGFTALISSAAPAEPTSISPTASAAPAPLPTEAEPATANASGAQAAPAAPAAAAGFPSPDAAGPARLLDRYHAATAYGRGARRSHCQNVRRGGRAVMLPLPHLPETLMRSTSGTSCPHGARTRTFPLRTDTSSVSTTMPGLVIKVMFPLRTAASICSVEAVITACVKSRMMFPLVTVRAIVAGTSQRPSRLALPLVHWIRTISLGAGRFTAGEKVIACETAAPSAGRSATRAASSA
jgi:alpha-1,2-mannosyltransferase